MFLCFHFFALRCSPKGCQSLFRGFKLAFDTRVLKLQMDSLGLVAKENEIKAKMTLFPSRKNVKVASHCFLLLNL